MKRIYLISHAYVPHWRYVGATKNSLSKLFSQKWAGRLRYDRRNTPLYKAFRCSNKQEWTIKEVVGPTKLWQHYEEHSISYYQTYINGLNTTNNGKGFGHTFAKPVISSLGNIYPSVAEAARAVNGIASGVSQVCRGDRSTYKGLTWRFI